MRLLATIVAFVIAITAVGTQEAEAKGPAYNSDYTFSQFVQGMLFPAIVAGALGIMMAYYAKESQALKAR
jgi:hypothetical protein